MYSLFVFNSCCEVVPHSKAVEGGGEMAWYTLFVHAHKTSVNYPVI